jgi:RNA polymerase sigma-70 factor (ECF subfamily)
MRARPGLDRLYREEAPGLERFLGHRTADAALAEDLVAETFVRAARSWHLYDDRRASAKTWLYAIALNCARADRRRVEAERAALARLPIAADPGASLDDEVARRVDLAGLIRTLSKDEREALALRYGSDLPMREVARRTGTSLTTADGRVHRALRKLRLAYESEARP